MAQRSFFVPITSWEGRHKSYVQTIEGQYDFKVIPQASEGLAAYNEVTAEFQTMIAQAVQDGKSLRAQGSSWSLSKVAVTEHRLINTKPLRIGFAIPESQKSSDYAGDREKLRFIECGYSIAEINNILFEDNLSLKASGSNNGQTLPGAVSTGTHGSAFRFGATPDFVVGIHLITGPSKHVYLERASYPVVKANFAERLGAELIRDDTLFNAALVSLGSFGIIHGMMIEARDLFLLHAFRSFVSFGPALKKAISTLDFSDLDLHNKEAAKLYHFQVTFNPNEGTPPTEAAVYLMFEAPWIQNYTPPAWDDASAGPGADGLGIMGELFEHLPSSLGAAVKPILNTQVKNLLAPYDLKGTIRDLFRGEITQGRVFASGAGMPLSRTLEALSIAFDTYANFGAVIPVLLTIRFVKRTKALLGFTKFEPTCVLEVDGLNIERTHEYANLVWNKFEQAGIPFTMHWGKFNAYLSRARLEEMYGENVQKWIDSRDTLLENSQVKTVFTNDFLRGVGLAT
jgi:hypothetical protein